MNTLVMVGAGGTGTMLLRPLVRYMSVVDPEFRLYIIDGDHVEAKNLERQDFGLSQVSMNKAVAALDLFGDPENMVAVPEYLSEDNMERYIADGDIVLICADNFTVRKRIEEHCMKLQHCAVINGGNETYSGSVQIWCRYKGKNVTPPISFLHPEVKVGIGDDRAEMTCAQAAAIPGGEQTILANLMSASLMMVALDKVLTDPTWTEVQFDIISNEVDFLDHRSKKGWKK